MDYGSLANWVSAVATTLGFGAAITQLRANLKDTRDARATARVEEDERREAMARAVGVKIEWLPGPDGGPPLRDGVIPAKVEIMNSGPYPISSAVLVIDADDYPKEVVHGTIFPGEHIRQTYDVRRREVVLGELLGGAELRFTDAFDAHWARSPHQLERRDDPARIC